MPDRRPSLGLTVKAVDRKMAPALALSTPSPICLVEKVRMVLQHAEVPRKLLRRGQPSCHRPRCGYFSRFLDVRQRTFRNYEKWNVKSEGSKCQRVGTQAGRIKGNVTMTTLKNWIKRMIEAVTPNQSGNAWDELKKARALEYAPLRSNAEESRVSRYTRLTGR